MFPILNPTLHLIPLGHPSAPALSTVSCIEPGLAICFTYDNIHVSMLFSQIIPPLPSPTESKRLFYTSVSLLLSHKQGYHYHLSKFHIYALVYCIGGDSLVAQVVKRLPAMRETRVQCLGWEVPWRRKWNPLQYLCLENSMDGEAWWATVYGVAKSRTRLKRLSSSSSMEFREME